MDNAIPSNAGKNIFHGSSRFESLGIYSSGTGFPEDSNFGSSLEHSFKAAILRYIGTFGYIDSGKRSASTFIIVLYGGRFWLDGAATLDFGDVSRDTSLSRLDCLGAPRLCQYYFCAASGLEL